MILTGIYIRFYVELHEKRKICMAVQSNTASFLLLA